MAMSAAACATNIVNSIGCTDADTKTQMTQLWTKILTQVFAEVCNATVVTNPGQAVQVSVSTGAGTTTSPGTANITG